MYSSLFFPFFQQTLYFYISLYSSLTDFSDTSSSRALLSSFPCALLLLNPSFSFTFPHTYSFTTTTTRSGSGSEPLSLSHSRNFDTSLKPSDLPLSRYLFRSRRCFSFPLSAMHSLTRKNSRYCCTAHSLLRRCVHFRQQATTTTTTAHNNFPRGSRPRFPPCHESK